MTRTKEDRARFWRVIREALGREAATIVDDALQWRRLYDGEDPEEMEASAAVMRALIAEALVAGFERGFAVASRARHAKRTLDGAPRARGRKVRP